MLANAAFYGQKRAIIVSEVWKAEEALALPVGDQFMTAAELKAYAAKAKSNHTKKVGDAWQARMLADEDVGQIFVDPYEQRRYDDKSLRGRTLCWEDMLDSISSSFAANLPDNYVEHDISGLFKAIVDLIDKDKLIELGHQLRALFQYEYKPSMDLMPWYDKFCRMRKLLGDEDEAFTLNDKVFKALLCSYFFDDPQLREEALKVKLDGDESLEEMMKPFQTLKMRLAKHHQVKGKYGHGQRGQPNVRVLNAKANAATQQNTEEKVCFQWRDTGSCRFGDKCRFPHDGKKNKKRRRVDNDGNESKADLLGPSGKAEGG